MSKYIVRVTMVNVLGTYSKDIPYEGDAALEEATEMAEFHEDQLGYKGVKPIAEIYLLIPVERAQPRSQEVTDIINSI